MNIRGRLVVTAMTAVGLLFASASPAGAAPVFKDFSARDVGGSLVCRIEFSEPPRVQAHDDLLKNRYFYVDFHGVSGPTQPVDWRTANRVGFDHLKRLYYPEQKVLRFVFYCTDARETRMEFKDFGRSFEIWIRSSEMTPSEVIGDVRRPRGARKLVIIDPGHGGKSVGCRTSKKINGKYYEEKDLVMAIAQRMARLFENSSNVDVILSRKGDEFVSLDERIKLADEAQADLFVSIHMNATSAKKKTARGMEVYHLSDGRSATNRYLEDIENDRGLEMDQGITGGETLRSLLTALSNEQFSRRRAESMATCQVISEVFKRNGPLRMRPQGVKSAAFRVLMNYNMPAVLVECGFLDHPSDAALLVQPGVQEAIATQLFNAINLYFSRTDPDFQAHLASVE